ncbi:MAG: hypothetical protein HRT87_11650, partial [Legionellales bacterium]|nr:hypothetical protein [Legionellales bacterium]
MKIILSILLKLILIFTLIASIVGYFILFTNVGLQITYKTARYFTSGKLLIKNLNGNIVDGLDIDNILYSSEDFKIDITKFKSNLSFNIFKRKLIIESILIENIAILSENSAPSSTETTTQNSKENEISSYLWLLNIEIKNININGLFIRNSTSSPLSFVNIKIINTIIDNEKIASEKIITTYNKYTYDASSKLSLEKPFKIQMDLNAKNNFIDQQYNIMVIGNLEHIECEVDGKNISNIDLKLNFDIKDNFLKLATNWKNGNIMYGNKNLIFSEGHANISTEIKSENNSKCSNIICLINLVTKNLENDKHVYFNNLVSDIKFNDYHITSKNNLDINQNLFSTDGELYIKNDSIFMDVQAQYSVDIKEDYIYFKNFKSRDQGNNINVNGVLSKNSNLKYDIYIEELSKYSSILGGKISSSGEILGDLSLPKLKISAVIDKINSPNFKNEHSEINITLDTKNLTGSGNIHLQGIEYDELNIDTVDLNLQNLKDSQRITLALNTEKIKINSNIKHILDKEKHTFIIQQLKIVDPTDSIWNIKGSPKILLEDEHILTDRDLCLINQNDKICLGISYLNK